MRVVVIQLVIAVFVSVVFTTLMGAVRTSEPKPENVKLRQVETTSSPARVVYLSSMKAENSRSAEISAPIDYD